MVGAGIEHRADRGERGETLIELMATVILMGVSIVALVASLLAVMRNSTGWPASA